MLQHSLFREDRSKIGQGLKLALTTITKPMIEENAVDYKAEEPKFSIREALGDTMTDEEQRRLAAMIWAVDRVLADGGELVLETLVIV